MRLAEAWRVAVTALRANRLRSALTMLGVVIGVAAVVVISAIGSGAKSEVEAQVEGLGSNLVIIVPGQLELGSAPTKSRLELADAERIGRALGQPDGVAVSIASGETVRAGGRSAFATVNGTNPAVPEVFVRPLARGSYLRQSDVDTRRRVAVLGAQLARDLFPGADPLGRQVTVGGVRFRVIGVFQTAGSGALGGGRDAEVHVPVTAAQRLFGDDPRRRPRAQGRLDRRHRAGPPHRARRAAPTATPTRSSAPSPRTRSSGPSGASSACSPSCWPPSPGSACSSAASASATSCW